MAARIGLPEGWTVEAAGIVASKFGPIPLQRFAAADGASCLAFSKGFDNPRVQISGWSCQPIAAAALRAFIACHPRPAGAVVSRKRPHTGRIVRQGRTAANRLRHRGLKGADKQRLDCGSARPLPARWALVAIRVKSLAFMKHF